jgi:hypothetical protein
MKNKKITYFLISGTAIIWLLLVYRFLTTFFDSNVPDGQTNKVVALAKDTTIVMDDTIHLLLNYDDPFLVSNFSYNKTPSSISGISKLQSKEKSWPTIEYSGLFYTDPKYYVINLIIDGKVIILRPGEAYNDISIVKADVEKVVLKKDSEQRDFIKMR